MLKCKQDSWQWNTFYSSVNIGIAGEAHWLCWDWWKHCQMGAGLQCETLCNTSQTWIYRWWEEPLKNVNWLHAHLAICLGMCFAVLSGFSSRSCRDALFQVPGTKLYSYQIALGRCMTWHTVALCTASWRTSPLSKVSLWIWSALSNIEPVANIEYLTIHLSDDMSSFVGRQHICVWWCRHPNQSLMQAVFLSVQSRSVQWDKEYQLYVVLLRDRGGSSVATV